MTLHSKTFGLVLLAALAAGLTGCENSDGGKANGPRAFDFPGLDIPEQKPPEDDPIPPFEVCGPAPSCNDSIAIDSDGSALMVTDPVVLAQFPLQKVIHQILTLEGVDLSAEEMMQRFFDGMNTSAGGKFADVVHCDSPESLGPMLKSGDSFSCPRAEGILASSTGFFKEGDPDSFIPVAVVNRFDLTPIDGSRCGQYRIIYAKRSGLTDPNNRVFLIFEAAMSNPLEGCLETCRPVAQFWAALQDKSSAEVAAALDTFFFEGMPGFKPAVHPIHYGLGAVDQGYGGHEGGQIRVSMHMEDPWSMREVKVDLEPSTGRLAFVPTTVKNNPPAVFFDPQSVEGNGLGNFFRDQFLSQNLPQLAGKELTTVQMFISPELNGVESNLGGAKKNDYFNAATSAGDLSFLDAVQIQIETQALDAGCPPEDPFDAEAALQRATVLSCAGCHAPKDFLGNDRKIGCGLTWPDSIGQVHVTEKSERSPALKTVFLPRRAEVMRVFLQACDPSAFPNILQPRAPGGGDFKDEMTPGDLAGLTLGGSQSH